MERENAWKSYSDKDLDKLEKLSSDYIEFISENKTERECVNASITMAEKAGYKPLAKAIKKQRKLKAGDKVYAQTHGKALILAVLGTDPLEDGFNILGAHIDSPRLDAKQNPLYENTDIALLDTHYYGGIKKYQWVTLPLAIHGVIALKAGRSIEVRVGEDPSDPVFCISDLLPHLGQKQMEKNAKEVIDAEDLDVIVGSRPLLFEKDKLNDDSPAWEKVAEKEPVKASVLKYLAEYYGIEEEDFLSAELEIVPAGRAREMGFDRSMVIGYGQDDRVCAYTSLVAQLAIENPKRTAVTVLVDKEEIGSVGATGMESLFFENTIAEIMAGSSSCVARSAHARCCPPTSPPRSTPAMRASSSPRTPPTWAEASSSTSTRAHVARAAATTRLPSLSPRYARSWTMPASRSRPPSSVASTSAAAAQSPTSRPSTTWTSSTAAWPCSRCTLPGRSRARPTSTRPARVTRRS